MVDILALYFMTGAALALGVIIRMVNGQYNIKRTSEFTQKMSPHVFLIYCFVMITFIWPKLIIDNL